MILVATGWSYPALKATPPEVVAHVMRLLAERNQKG